MRKFIYAFFLLLLVIATKTSAQSPKTSDTKVLFDIGKHTPTEEIKEEIRSFCGAISGAKWLAIKGHYDYRHFPEKSDIENYELSLRRANAIRGLFIDFCNLSIPIATEGSYEESLRNVSVVWGNDKGPVESLTFDVIDKLDKLIRIEEDQNKQLNKSSEIKELRSILSNALLVVGPVFVSIKTNLNRIADSAEELANNMSEDHFRISGGIGVYLISSRNIPEFSLRVRLGDKRSGLNVEVGSGDVQKREGKTTRPSFFSGFVDYKPIVWRSVRVGFLAGYIESWEQVRGEGWFWKRSQTGFLGPVLIFKNRFEIKSAYRYGDRHWRRYGTIEKHGEFFFGFTVFLF